MYRLFNNNKKKVAVNKSQNSNLFMLSEWKTKHFWALGQLDLRIPGHSTVLPMFGSAGLSKLPYTVKILSNDITYECSSFGSYKPTHENNFILESESWNF